MKKKIGTTNLYLRILLRFYKTNKYFIKAIVFMFNAKIKRKAMDSVEYCISNDKKLVYVVNSKVACSSIKKCIMESDGIVIPSEYYSEIHRLSKKIGYRKMAINKNQKNYFYFSFVRNPIERIASLYINKFLAHEKIERTGFEYKNYLNGILEQDMSFDEFVRMIVKIPDKYADRHFKSQYFLLFKESKKMDYVGKLENINEDFNFLVENYNLLPLSRINSSGGKSSYLDLYSQELIDLIYKRYIQDFEKFGYSKPEL